METTTKEFIELYNNPKYTADEIKQKLGLNNNNYKKLKQEAGIHTRRNVIKGKYSTKMKTGNISINKRIKGNRIYLGVYKTQEEANKVINTCEKHNWNIENAEVQDTIQKYRIRNKNYVKVHDRYYVYKNINGKRITFDSFKFKEDAEDCVKLLEKLDWNKTVYDNLKVII